MSILHDKLYPKSAFVIDEFSKNYPHNRYHLNEIKQFFFIKKKLKIFRKYYKNTIHHQSNTNKHIQFHHFCYKKNNLNKFQMYPKVTITKKRLKAFSIFFSMCQFQCMIFVTTRSYVRVIDFQKALGLIGRVCQSGSYL